MGIGGVIGRCPRRWTVAMLRSAGSVVALVSIGACAQPPAPGTVRPSVHPSQSAVDSPTAAPGCPEPGVRITADRGDAAMGYREMALRMTNCSDRPYAVQGRADIVVLDKDRGPVDVAVVPSVHWTASPHPVTLAPGQSAMAVMSWRNTVTDPTVVATSGAFLSVAPVPGAPRQLVTPPSTLDLGNTGRLEISVWL